MPTDPKRRPDPVLIRTKISRPPGRPGFVERRRLLDRLDEDAQQHRVTLLSAPPGFGKTTLVTQWLAHRAVPTAWLSLDKGDSDPERLVRYIVAAVEASTAHRLPRSAALVAGLTPPPFEYLCELFVSELASTETPLLLVLDDYHTIASSQVDHLVERLVQAMPSSMHLLVLSRSDPPWPLEHWRARGWLGEIRARDLRFSVEEARRFFSLERGAVLSSGTIDKLHARAEGWIAALRLVQLSLRGAVRPEEQARTLSGSDRLVASYLMSEVLAAQPPEIVRFLTVTAPLSRFSAPLCDHLLPPAAGEPHGGETLARVLQLNLFLVPLDADGEWYRYHHLFQDLLLHHLPALAQPERRAAIDHAAADWLAREGFIEEALGHLIHAGAIDAAADLLGGNLRAVLDADMTRQVVQRWLAMFPPGAERGRLPLLVAQTYLRMARWDLRGMGELIEEAMPLLGESVAPEGQRFRADIEALAAFMHYWSGNPAAALGASSRALDILPPRRGGMARWLATRYKAGGLSVTGRKNEALALLERAIEDASATAEPGIDLLLLTQAVAHWYANELGAAAVSARRMLALHEAKTIQPYHLGHAHHMLGLCAYAQNRLADAATEFEQVVAMRYEVNTRTYQDSLIGLSLIARAAGDATGVARYAAEVRTAALQAGDPISLRIADWFEVRLALDASDAPAPVTSPPAADDFMSFWLEVPSVTYAESLLRHRTTGVRASALPVIERALAKVEANHNRFQALVFSLLRALALADRGEEAAALEVLAATVREAEPSGVVRPFLDRGPRLLPLLEALRSCDVPQSHLQLLLAAFEARPADRVVHVDMGTPAPGSSLSNRELDVLALLTQRLSNKEIAQRLHVSPETVKKHTRNLYMKLEVHGRREAVAKAVADRLVTVRS